MTENDLTYTFVVDRTPDQVFAAVNDVRGWWAGEFDGVTDRLGAEFTYRYQDMHRSTQRVTEFVPGRKVVWHVVDAWMSFVADPAEWKGTDVVFEITPAGDGAELRFTHVGLDANQECYEACSSAWGHYVNDGLRQHITAGAPAVDQAVDQTAAAARENAVHIRS